MSNFYLSKHKVYYIFDYSPCAVVYNPMTYLCHNGSFYLLIPFAISPVTSPFSLLAPSLCSLWVCLHFALGVHFFLLFIFQYKWNHTKCVFAWLILLGIRPTRYKNVAAKGKIVLFYMAEKYSVVYMYHLFSIHSSTEGHLDFFISWLL